MIWYSIWAMTVIDVVVIAMVVCALGFLLKQRDRLAWAPAHFGLLIVFAGLSIIALFYFADLLTMHMLPMFMAKSRAMDLMHELHFNARWLVALIGVGAISLGLVIAGRATIVLIDNLEVRERQLSDAQRIGRIGHWRWMLKSGQVVWSDEMYRIFGWDMDSTIPTFDKVLGSIHPEERQKIVDIRDSAIAAGRSYEFVCRMVRPDDEVRVVWVEGRLESDDGGDLVSIFGVLQDVTERKKSEETLDRQSRSIQLMHRVAVAANEASVTDDALQVCLDEVCNYAGWQVGHAYMRDVNSTGELLPTTLWHLDEPERFETFRQVTERTSFAAGVGLPGRVFESGEPAWTMDVTQDANFPQAKLADDIGLRAGFAFPVLVGQEVTAVLEFFSIDAAEPDAHILFSLRRPPKPRRHQTVGSLGDRRGMTGRKSGFRINELLLHQARQEPEPDSLHAPLPSTPNPR